MDPLGGLMSDRPMTDQQRIEDLDKWARTLFGHLSVSPIRRRPSAGRAAEPPRDPDLGDTDVDELVPDRAHLRDLNQAVSACLLHVRALYRDRLPQAAPVSRVHPLELGAPPLPIEVGPAPLELPPDNQEEDTAPYIDMPARRGRVRDPRPTPMPEPPAQPAVRVEPRRAARMPEAPPWVLGALVVAFVCAGLALVIPVLLARALLGF